MNLPWGDEKSNKFVTNVGLITSNGPYGHNIMAAEWTHHISYNPGLIAVCIQDRFDLMEVAEAMSMKNRAAPVYKVMQSIDYLREREIRGRKVFVRR